VQAEKEKPYLPASCFYKLGRISKGGIGMSESKIKKAVIREDLLAITGDFRKAIILNQFIYWSERVSDADKFIEKENEIAKNNGEEEKELFYGWIYKNAEELAEEVMLGLSASQIRRYISDLVKLGYISKRTNPKYKWDRTLQYRVNLVKIAKVLKEKGYPLSDYKIDIPDDENSIAHGCTINSELEKNQSTANAQAIPETTTEINYRDYKQKTLSGERAVSERSKPKEKDTSNKTARKKEANALFEQLWSLYPVKKGKGSVTDTQKTKLLEIGYEELERAISRYIRYVESVDYLHYKNGSTFFNSGYIDYLDANYECSDNNNTPNMKPKNYNNQKSEGEKDYKTKLTTAKQKAIQDFELDEKYWEGVADAEAEVYLKMMGIL